MANPKQIARALSEQSGKRMEIADKLIQSGVFRGGDAEVARAALRRDMLALASGGYTGANRSRATLRNWSPEPVSADDEVSYDLPTLRARSRDLVRNAPLAGGAIETSVTHVVGTGLTMQSRIDADWLGLDQETAAAWQENTEREWRLWCESTACDITRTQNFYGLQSLAFRSVLESGDVLAILLDAEQQETPYRLAMQLIEADRISNKDRAANSDTLVDGIVLNQAGAAVAYHIASRHPIAYKSSKGTTWREVPARGAQSGRLNAIHLFERTRPGQTRGVPMLAPVIEPLKQLGRYTDAELASAVNASIFSIFIKMDPEAFENLFDDTGRSNIIKAASSWDGTINTTIENPAKAVNLLPGESIEAPEPGRPSSQFDPFVQSIISQIGARLGIPHEVLIKHFDSSYSAARAALLDAWRFFRCRRDWLATYFCQPVYQAWLDEAIAMGRIDAPGWFADAAYRKAWSSAAWIGDGPGSIDPLKEVQAAKARIEEGISTRAAESVLWDGADWEQKHRQRVKEERLRREGGLAAAEPQRTQPDNEEDEED